MSLFSRFSAAPQAPLPSPAPRRVDLGAGFLLALVVLSMYGGMALSVDFPRSAFGFQSDESTYYMMAHSLASDGDLTYRREDLERVWREFPGGPAGVFLKRGRDVQGVGLQSVPPFFTLVSAEDPDRQRLFYGKSFAYALIAAPFVKVFGTNGFLVLHAVLLAVFTLVAYLFLAARCSRAVATVLAGAYVAASVAPAYIVWITPEVMNLVLVAAGYFCWLYKEVQEPRLAPRGTQWLFGQASDSVAAGLLALATFSKPSNVLLIVPVAIWLVWRRRWRTAVLTCGLFGVAVAALFAVNVAISGEWNFQGGDRRTYYGGYPFQTQGAGFDIGMDRTTNEVLTEVIFGSNSFEVFVHNLGYFFVGRYSGLVAYFFPAVFALLAFAIVRHRRAPWQYLVLAAGLAEILLLIVWIPYNYFGGGGVLGNRYFMNVYGIFLFLIPPIQSVALAVVPWIVGGFFSAQVTLNPFYSSFHPAQHAKQGPLRLLPVELSLFNDLPTMTDPHRVRLPFGTNPRFQITFLDDNAYIETNAFWVKGASEAEILVRYNTPATRMHFAMTAGPVPTRVTLRYGRYTWKRDFQAGETRRMSFPLDDGFPYQASRIWRMSIESSSGFIPLFADPASTDNRYLGIRVVPELKLK